MNKLRQFKDFIIKTTHKGINYYNRQRLTNSNPTIISSDCCGGIIYNWLRLKFNSPFINLYMNNRDFLTALENFDEFLEGEIKEVKDSGKKFPVGEGIHGEKIFFMHYPDFETAITKWNERKKRINKRNLGIIFSNLGEGINDLEGIKKICDRFMQLPFKNKVILCGENYRIPNCVSIKGFKLEECNNICYYDRIGRRYIDKFDYVSFINSFSV